MSHPGDDGSLRTAFDGNSFRASDGSAPDGRRMGGDGLSDLLSECIMLGREFEELQYRGDEILDVFGLDFFPSTGSRGLSAGVLIGRAFGYQFLTNPIDGRLGCPNAE